MALPSSTHQTFDTSLVDVQKSFSSTETNTSGSSGKENSHPVGNMSGRPASPYQTVPTDLLYDQWASTYDTDGNVLQAMDDLQLNDLLTEFGRLTRPSASTPERHSSPLRILDLGCGTGRNTVKLLAAPWSGGVEVTGWDSSPAMLEIARRKCEAIRPSNVGIELEQVDIADLGNIPDRYSNYFDGLVSTLVLEHISIQTFFAILARTLKPGSHALVTNMHPDMGKSTRAGYKTASGERFKATSYVYTVAETVSAAENAALEVILIREATVEAGLLDGAISNGKVAERARKWLGTKIWYGMMVRRK